MNKPTEIELEALRLRIAALCGMDNLFVLKKRGMYWRSFGAGYTDHIEEAGRYTKEEADRRVYPHDEPVTAHAAPLPDYCNDLNAIHEAENHLMVNNFVNEWLEAICMVVNGFPYKEGFWEHSVAIARAEAWQRAIALDRTLSEKPLL